jgi:hypothetical protein
VLRKKKWLIVGVVAVVVLLVAGVVGGVVAHAQSPTPGASAVNPEKAFADRVAKILGEDPAKVEAAFTQAQKDIQDEALTNKLNSLVQQGKLTQQQADQYKQWWESRPNVPAVVPNGPMGGGFGMKGGFRCPPGFGKAPAPPSPTASPSVSK